MLVPIDNTPRAYAWGSTTAIAELLGRVPSGQPEAELWFGTHPGSPARIVEDGRPLTAISGELPFLLKVLAADAPLSIQAHPTAEIARAGFARENAAGVALDARERNYRDPFAKPEMIYALSEGFRALCGFRSVAETRNILIDAEEPGLEPLLGRLGGDADLGPVLVWLLRGDDTVVAVLHAVVDVAERVAGGPHDHPSWETVRLLVAHYPEDPGVIVSLLLHSVELGAGDALYLPAGNIHAYLGGLGIELMGASDNVLRGGLTNKHIDLVELAAVVDARPLPAPFLHGDDVAPGVRRFRAPDAPLELIAVRDGETVAPGGAIVLALDPARVGGESMAAGTAAYLPEPTRVGGDGRLFIAVG